MLFIKIYLLHKGYVYDIIREQYINIKNLAIHLHLNQIQKWGPLRPDSGFDSDVGVLQTGAGPHFLFGTDSFFILTKYVLQNVSFCNVKKFRRLQSGRINRTDQNS